jgi:NAD(P) transhydrogenase
MDTFDYDLVCIGSGPAGQRGAVQAAKMGRRVALIEKRPMLGGVCVDTGTIPSKTFREAVVWATGAARAGSNGAKPAGRPGIDMLLARIDAVVQREAEVIANQLGRNGVDVLCGEASFIDPHRLRVSRGSDGWKEITAANVLIASGTHAVPPPTATPDDNVVITSDDITKLRRLPRTMAVIGAGVIGIEYASMFSALGVEVTVIDKRDRPLEFLDSEIVDELIHQMRKQNVVFRLGEAVETVEAEGGIVPRAVIRLESGKRVVADAAMFSVGRVGATESLALGSAGLTADARGRISVGSQFRTSVPHIFAAGDVIGYPSLAATSSEQGRLAACYALGGSAPPMAAHFPVGIYAVPEISMVGATEAELTKARVPYEVGVARYREIARGQIVGDDSGFFKMLSIEKTRDCSAFTS